VDELNEGRSLYMGAPLMVAGTSRKYDQHGPKALPAAGNDVFRDLIHQRDRTFQARADYVVHGRKVLFYERAYLFQGHRETDPRWQPHILADAGFAENGLERSIAL
jgi:hypothetical protein